MSQETNFNIEIAKIVGEEVAKRALGTFNEEQLKELVDSSIKSITTRQKINQRDHWCDKYKDSKLDETVAQSLWAEVKDQITQRVASEEHKQAMQEIAVTMVDDIIETTKRKMVDDISSRMANFFINPDMSLQFQFDQYMREFISRLPRNY
jgi:hypothetical protein